MAHRVPYSPLPFFTFETFGYALVIFKYPQTRIRPQHQINQRRFTPYAAARIRSGYREKEAFAMKASINKAAIILPFSRASEAAGFFLGTSLKPGIDFSLLKCISTCHLKRYVSRTSPVLIQCGSEVTATMNALNAAVFSCNLLPLRDARCSSLFRNGSHASCFCHLAQTLTGIHLLSGRTAKTAASPLFSSVNLPALSILFPFSVFHFHHKRRNRSRGRGI
jgi:hypothetical protein